MQVHALIDDETLVIVENRRVKLMNLKTWKITRTLPGKTCGKWVPYVGYLKSRKGKAFQISHGGPLGSNPKIGIIQVQNVVSKRP